MKVTYDIGEQVSLNPEGFRQMGSELEILITKEIRQYESLKKTLADSTIVGRRIYVPRKIHSENVPASFKYTVEDNAVEDDRLITVGRGEYTSEDLRLENEENHPRGVGGSGGS